MSSKKTISVYDPACGTAGMLIDTYRLLKAQAEGAYSISLATGGGKGEFFTPPSVVKLIISLLQKESAKPVTRTRKNRDRS